MSLARSESPRGVPRRNPKIRAVWPYERRADRPVALVVADGCPKPGRVRVGPTISTGSRLGDDVLKRRRRTLSALGRPTTLAQWTAERVLAGFAKTTGVVSQSTSGWAVRETLRSPILLERIGRPSGTSSARQQKILSWLQQLDR